VVDPTGLWQLNPFGGEDCSAQADYNARYTHQLAWFTAALFFAQPEWVLLNGQPVDFIGAFALMDDKLPQSCKRSWRPVRRRPL
jgi:hypothetical protein